MAKSDSLRRLALSVAAGATLCAAAPTTGHSQEAGKAYLAAELTTAPRIKNQNAAAAAIDRSVPANMRSVSGRVQLRFIVEPNGKVDPESIEIVVASATQFGDAARRAVRDMEFVPGQLNGTAVRSVVMFPISFGG